MDDSIPDVPFEEVGLEDHSDELEELSEQDIQIRFYHAMASIHEDEPGLVHRLSAAIADVMFDFCVIALRHSTHDDQIEVVAAHDVNPAVGERIGTMLQAAQVLDGEVLQRVARDGQTSFTPYCQWMLQLDGTPPRTIEVHSAIVVPMKTQQGEVFGTLAIGRHATTRPYGRADLALVEWIAAHVGMKLETARLYRALRRTNRALSAKNRELAEAVRARDIFLATASHELKTPLSTLALQVEILRVGLESAEVEESARLAVSVDALHRQVNRLSSLVSQLLDVSQLTEGRMELEVEELDLSRLVHEVVERFHLEAERQGCRIVVSAPSSVPGFWDRCRLDQILSNLLSNALKYGGGEDIDVSLDCDAQSVTLSVRDRGAGIPHEARARIFERFERIVDSSKAGGIGLGLWIVRQIVNRFGGSISVEDAPERGSTFRVQLPLDVRPR